MPSDYIKSLSNKYNIGINKLENSWIAAKKQVNKEDYSEEDYYKIVTYRISKLIKFYNYNSIFISFNFLG